MKNIFGIQSLNKTPSIIILIGLLSGIIPLSFSHTYPLFYTVVAALAINIVIAVLTNWKTGVKTISWCLLGIIIFLFYNSQFSKNYSTLLPSGNFGAQLRAIATDSELTDNKIHWLPAPKYIKMSVLAIRYSNQDKWIKSSGLVNVLLPYSNKKGLLYGEILELDGNFILPQNSPLPGSFDYKRYLKSQGINRLFIASNYKIKGYAGFPFNIYRKIFSFRNLALSYLCSGIKSERTSAFLAGFFFGCRQGISKQMKQLFLRSGTIHILAISGLHVGILALILLFIFKPLPITARYLLIPFFLFCYVFLTGFRPSGLRALIMISVLCFHKAFFYPIRPVNSIAFAAVVILLFNPLALNNTGFQFSFIIAGFLVLSWEQTTNWLRIIKEKNSWLISADFTFFKKIKYAFREKILLLTITSIVAGIAGTGLILYYQSLFIPSMIFLNILILPFLLPLFLIGFIKILVFAIFGTSLFLINTLLDSIISIIFYIADWGAYSAFTKYYPQPPLIILILFYILLAGFFLTHNKKAVLILTCFMGGIFVLWLSGNIFGSGKVTVIQGTGSTPSAIIIKPNSYNRPILINCPERLGRIIVDKLRKEGINSLKSIIITKGSKKYSGGILSLLSQVPTKQIILPKNIHKTKLYRDLIAFCLKNNIDIVYLEDKISKRNFRPLENRIKVLTNRNSSIRADYNTSKTIRWNKTETVTQFIWKASHTSIGIETKKIYPGLKKIVISINGKNTDIFDIKNSNFFQLFECSLPLNG